jgi:hypothetical protein
MTETSLLVEGFAVIVAGAMSVARSAENTPHRVGGRC